MKQSGYLKRQKQITDTYRKAERDTATQLVTDMFILALNDPEIMGRDTIGPKRMARIIQGVQNELDNWTDKVLDRNDEQDYWQVKLDERLRPVIGADFVPFETRYPWLKKAK